MDIWICYFPGSEGLFKKGVLSDKFRQSRGDSSN